MIVTCPEAAAGCFVDQVEKMTGDMAYRFLISADKLLNSNALVPNQCGFASALGLVL